MSYSTLADLNNFIANKAISDGLLDAAENMVYRPDRLCNEGGFHDRDFSDQIFDGYGRADLITLRNRVNGKCITFYVIRSGAEPVGGGTKIAVESTYELRVQGSTFGNCSLILSVNTHQPTSSIGTYIIYQTWCHSVNEGFGSTNSQFWYNKPHHGQYWLNKESCTVSSFTGGTSVVEVIYGQHSANGNFYGFFDGMDETQPVSVNDFKIEYNASNIVLSAYVPPGPTPDPWAPSQEDFNMQLELWSNFNKRYRSTKRPSTAGTILDVKLIEDTSIINPSFILANTTFTWNYCKFGGRYYYINNIISLNNNLIRINCEIDVLATWRDNIKGSSAYIDRAAWATGHLILDDTNPPTETVEIKTAQSGSPVVSSDAGNYIICTSSSTGFHMYQVDKANFDLLYNALWDQNPAPPATELTLEQRQTIINSIVSCIRVPFTFGGGGSGPMHFANFVTTQAVGSEITSFAPYNVAMGSLSIPFPSGDHGLSGETYIDHAPYTTGILYLPFVGVVSLDLDVFATLRSVKINAAIDKIAASVTYKLMNPTTDAIIATYSGSFGTEVPISAGGYDKRGLLQATLTTLGGTVAMVGGIASGNLMMAAGGVGAIAAGTMSAQKAAEIHSMTGGALSSNLGYYVGGGYAKATVITRVPTNWDLDHNKATYGLPVKSVGSLNASGFVKTLGAQISMAGTQQEREMVNGLLDSGIYIE